MVIVLSDQENLPQIPSSVDVCRDELRLVSIARAEAENPGNIDARCGCVAGKSHDRDGDFIGDLIRLVRDVSVGGSDERDGLLKGTCWTNCTPTNRRERPRNKPAIGRLFADYPENAADSRTTPASPRSRAKYWS
jgi:hypothetical protein